MTQQFPAESADVLIAAQEGTVLPHLHRLGDVTDALALKEAKLPEDERDDGDQEQASHNGGHHDPDGHAGQTSLTCNIVNNSLQF